MKMVQIPGVSRGQQGQRGDWLDGEGLGNMGSEFE